MTRSADVIVIGSGPAGVAAREKLGLIPMKPPYRRVCVLRHNKEQPKRYAIEEHPSSFAALMNMPFNFKPVASDAQLKSPLVE